LRDREALLLLLQAALDAVEGARCTERSLREHPPGAGPFSVLGAGKAACAMARGARAALGARLRGGELVTADGHGCELPGLTVREAAHPLPDERSVLAAEAALALAARLGPDDALIVLLSGGASALWSAPAPGLELEDLRRTHELLLRSGADIHAINCVRKHLDRIKGGGLARAAAPARVLTLAISDVRGDAPGSIGSAPTAADPTTCADALAVLERASLLARVPERVRAHRERGAAAGRAKRAAPGEPALARTEYRVVASLEAALEAAARRGEEMGLSVARLGACLYGEAREEARALAGRARRAREQRTDLFVAGGEPFVRVAGPGRGGRMQELALAFALEIDGLQGITGLFAGSDGSDGATRAAGAGVDAGSVARARVVGLDAREHLARNDSHPLLEASGDLVTTGPTGTNVADLALVRVRR
jgi:glycerate-2-kinase